MEFVKCPLIFWWRGFLELQCTFLYISHTLDPTQIFFRHAELIAERLSSQHSDFKIAVTLHERAHVSVLDIDSDCNLGYFEMLLICRCVLSFMKRTENKIIFLIHCVFGSMLYAFDDHCGIGISSWLQSMENACIRSCLSSSLKHRSSKRWASFLMISCLISRGSADSACGNVYFYAF